ncbi:TIGR04222 domain-containing membrane protein [Kitasatospora sp. GP82]|uniref:TIGR04222 domain-containing membrane protein n=1 Tax=Kitasatospora sp. GP82 TaxID=3035089 RepID=UPI002475226E|nr:TIGR04222 domain-containing membrane protein [Kitasatospora sp. GP82]
MWIVALVIACLLVGTTLLRARAARRRMLGAADLGAPKTSAPALYDVACLTGSERRVVEVAIVGMHETGRLIAARSGKVTITTKKARDPVEMSILLAAGTTWQRDLLELIREASAGKAARDVRTGLVRHGLALDSSLRYALIQAVYRVESALVAALVLGGLAVGWVLWQEQQVVWPITAFAVLTGSGFIIKRRMWPGGATATPAAKQYLALALKESPWRPHSDAGVDEAGAARLGAVALRGLSALPNGHDLLTAKEGSDTRSRTVVRTAARSRSAASRRRSSHSSYTSGDSGGGELGFSCGGGGGHSHGGGHSGCGGGGHSGCGGGGHSGCGGGCGGGS